MDVFLFDDYKEFLRSTVAESSQRGTQSLLAAAAGCQRAFISQVLNSHVDLTLDHAAGICRHLNFTEIEADYFMELVSMARAGTENMRQIVYRRLVSLRRRHADLSEKFSKSSPSNIEAQSQYYSSWHWMAIHVLTSIPHFQTSPKIAERLGVPLEQVEKILICLEKMGVLTKTKTGKWLPADRDVFLPRSSPMTFSNHLNWRLRALDNIQRGEQDSVHYTAVHALSRKDIEEIKSLLVDFIATTREIVTPSPEEEIVSLTLDFFRV